jgi:hypothetical protein
MIKMARSDLMTVNYRESMAADSNSLNSYSSTGEIVTSYNLVHGLSSLFFLDEIITHTVCIDE